MVTLVENKTTAKYIGLSTDTKPTQISDSVGMPNGSRFLEMDTGKKYYWSTNNQQWGEMPSSSGGGGSSSDGGAFFVNVTIGSRWSESTADKTYSEILEAYQSGMVIYAKIESTGFAIVIPMIQISDHGVTFQATNCNDENLISFGVEIGSDNSCAVDRFSYDLKEGKTVIVELVNNNGWYTPDYAISEIIEMIQEYKMTVVLQEESSGTIYQMCNLNPNAESIAFSAMKFETDSTTTPEYWLMTGYVSNNKQWVCNH